MKQVIETERIPIKLWLDDIEGGALQQARNLANLPFAFGHIAIMPDSHQGYGMPIGGVLATRDYIVPNGVGVDIGCGMCAVQTSLTEIDDAALRGIMGQIRMTVPTGFSSHKRPQTIPLEPGPRVSDTVQRLWNQTALLQAGTLGGGNHFIEIQRGNDGRIWIMIHSGSRGLGFKTANHYAKLAKDLNVYGPATVPPAHDLAPLPLDDEVGRAYFEDMKFCTLYAYHNRRLMLDRVQEAVVDHVPDAAFEPEFNLPHNYAEIERHFGQDVIVHRKGATSARAGEVGIIPGSQGASSYIVRGKGNPESFESCSHGAGRRMGRKAAQRELNLNAEVARLRELGVLHAIRGIKDLDEAPGAYKDIKQVMENQEDLVDIAVKLRPLGVIKSHDGGYD